MNAATERRFRAALPNEECEVPPRECWSELEKWVWQEVGSGRIADINAKLGKSADPQKPDDWGPERRISPAFVETILLHDPWRSAIPRHGVRISGVLFEDDLNLEEAELPGQLSLHRCRFNCAVTLVNLRAPRDVSLMASVLAGPLNLAGAIVEGSLLLEATSISELAPPRASNSGLGAENFAVNLLGIKVGKNLELQGAKVRGTLDMDSASIGKDLVMSDGAEFADVDLRAARIGDWLNLSWSRVTGELVLDSVRVGGHVFMINASFETTIDFSFATVGSGVYFDGSRLAGVNLTGTRIAGELSLVSDNAALEWADGAKMILRNARVDAIRDEVNAWPARIDLDGFSYSRFGGFGADTNPTTTDRAPSGLAIGSERMSPIRRNRTINAQMFYARWAILRWRMMSSTLAASGSERRLGKAVTDYVPWD